ncbi:alpha-amylase [Waterburya agarophytonicola K14]|uniref:Alpha-amylase n=1 Tax=Waterburya agarophytonicola KI4 TaxID=2874699 RepID=A0A964BQ67_9CYAN|nr:glycoside hydrolase family 13 protein [Waterburya agarophytonicola]MCC0176827.1 alpha-amylase [Waterburya agarophytonicola KI4]
MIKTPDWVKNAVFYQIFPDRFAKGTSTLKGQWQASKYEGWDATPTYQGYKGGNLWGVIDKLDYLEDLGINAIYFTPIFQSASNHRYHTHDYYQVDPMLGGNAAFDALIEAAHKKDMKVVLDGVFNHASRGFFFFNDILENGPNSPWLDWFVIHGWPLSAYDGDKPANYQSWIGDRALPEFNHDNPQVKEYIMQVAEYWLHKGIDGWRLDVPNEVDTPGFWQEFRDRVKAVNPDAYIVGEIWGDASYWLDGTQFDGVMNYRFTEPTIAFAGGENYDPQYCQGELKPYPPISGTEYAIRIDALLKLYDWEIQLAQLNLLDSHDTPRMLTTVREDKQSFLLSTVLLMTFPGAPSIFYGDEVGLIGGKDPDCRRVFPEAEKWDVEILKAHKELIGLRHKYPSLRTGSYHTLYADRNVYIFARVLDEEEIIVAVNIGQEQSLAEFVVTELQSQPSNVVYGSGRLEWHNTTNANKLEITLPAKSSLVAS